MTGDTISRTTTDTGTALTASEVRGTGADIIPHGTHGISRHGDITDGMTLGTTVQTGDGTTHGITEDTGEDGMTLGIMEDTGAGMIHGTTTITDGTTHTGDTITTITDRAITLTIIRMCGMAQDIRPGLKEYSEAPRRSEEESAAEVLSAGTKAQEEARLPLQGLLHQEDLPSAGLQLPGQRQPQGPTGYLQDRQEA